MFQVWRAKIFSGSRCSTKSSEEAQFAYTLRWDCKNVGIWISPKVPCRL